MSIPTSLENQLLLACTHTDFQADAIQALSRKISDWDGFLQKGIYAGLSPLIYSKLKKAKAISHAPPNVIERFENLYYGYVLENTKLYRKLKIVLSAFSQQNIPIIVLKGAALAECVYEDIGLRPMFDVDLLIKKEDISAAEHLLEQLQYSPQEIRHTKEWYRTSHHHLVPYASHDGWLVLELHHHIVPPAESVIFPIAELWQRARPTHIASVPTLVLCWEDMLLHLCLHATLEHYFRGKLNALCDMTQVINRFNDEIDWAQLVGIAKNYGVEKYLYYALWLSQEMVGAVVPYSTLEELKTSFRSSSIEDIFIKRFYRKVIFNKVYFISSSFPPSWFIHDTFLELYSPKPLGTKIGAILVEFYRGLKISAKDTNPRLGFFLPLYAITLHPIYLLWSALRPQLPDGNLPKQSYHP